MRSGRTTPCASAQVRCSFLLFASILWFAHLFFCSLRRRSRDAARRRPGRALRARVVRPLRRDASGGGGVRGAAATLRGGAVLRSAARLRRARRGRCAAAGSGARLGRAAAARGGEEPRGGGRDALCLRIGRLEAQERVEGEAPPLVRDARRRARADAAARRRGGAGRRRGRRAHCPRHARPPHGFRRGAVAPPRALVGAAAPRARASPDRDGPRRARGFRRVAALLRVAGLLCADDARSVRRRRARRALRRGAGTPRREGGGRRSRSLERVRRPPRRRVAARRRRRRRRRGKRRRCRRRRRRRRWRRRRRKQRRRRRGRHRGVLRASAHAALPRQLVAALPRARRRGEGGAVPLAQLPRTVHACARGPRLQPLRPSEGAQALPARRRGAPSPATPLPPDPPALAQVAPRRGSLRGRRVGGRRRGGELRHCVQGDARRRAAFRRSARSDPRSGRDALRPAARASRARSRTARPQPRSSSRCAAPPTRPRSFRTGARAHARLTHHPRPPQPSPPPQVRFLHLPLHFTRIMLTV